MTPPNRPGALYVAVEEVSKGFVFWATVAVGETSPAPSLPPKMDILVADGLRISNSLSALLNSAMGTGSLFLS